MKQFWNILKFEFGAYLKNKVFVGITLLLVVALGITLSFPRFTGMVSQKEETPVEKAVILLADNTVDSTITLSAFEKGMPEKRVLLTDKGVDELKALVDSGEISGAIVVTSPTKYTYIVKNITMYDDVRYRIDEIMATKYRMVRMAQIGVTPDVTNEILFPTIEGEMIQIGKDQAQNFFYTYVLIFALYMAILLYGQFVATSVATEKSSRAMELLITSAKPTNLMFGKVIGSGLAGLLQLTAIFGSSFIFFNLNKDYWGENDVVNSIFNMPLSIFLYALLFFVLGYFIYAFLYGAVGSLASKVEDINTSVMPITFLFIIAFFVVMFSMSSGNVDSTVMIVASYIPFTSPMAMFVRIAMGDVAPIEIVISVAVLLVSTIGIGYLSAKIYKIGVLLYGKPPKLSSIIKSLKS